MKPFLKKVADVYALNEADRLYKYCFVLPNRRSCVFFESYLSDALNDKHSIFPELTTISDFIDEYSDLVEAGRVEQLFLLYQAYRTLAERDQKQYDDFDHFLHLGDMLLNDFNDIDRYMVDAKELFFNMRNLENIKTDYLSDEQIAVIKEYWGVDKKEVKEDSLFVQSSYVNLWDNMYELYNSFLQALEEKGLTYGGQSYRRVAEKINKMGADDFNFERIIFVGFSTLSNAERMIFERFKKLGIADFYWDFESAFLDKDNKGSYFLNQYIPEFKSIYDIMDSKPTVPNINILSVPSGSGQGLVVRSVLEQLVAENKLDVSDAVNTAIVLPEEKYVNSVLDSVPEMFKSINITMGMSVGQSPIASFLTNLANLEHRKKELKGELSYFYEDVEMLASHPYAVMVGGTGINDLVGEIHRKNAYFVSKSMIAEGGRDLSDLFGINEEEPMVYVERILTRINSALEKDKNNLIERYFVVQYMQALNQIKTVMNKFNVHVEKQSLFFLLSRTMSGAIVPFEGKPLHGLQIMGVLETRSLDFKNIIVLSMNEKVFPTKHYTKSFIPNSIRSAYGLSTFKYQDSMYAYYFFRMISRAENVFLLYDSRVQGVSSGEESRYIKQLAQVYNRGRNHQVIYDYSVFAIEEPSISIRKTDRIMSILNDFRSTEDKDNIRYLSASSINTYLDCQFKFYLQKVEGFQEEDSVTDFIDSSTFGTVVHGAMEKLYGREPRHIDSAFFDRYLRNKNKTYVETIELEKVVTYAVNKYYKRLDESRCYEKPTDEADLIAKIVMYYVKNALIQDHRLGAFDCVASEKKLAFNWDMGDGVSFNFKCFIDRIDFVEGKLRIVDYKTGLDDVQISKPDDFEDLFAPDSNGAHKKALLQLLLYCNAYATHEHYADDITPVVYKFRDVDKCLNGKYDIQQSYLKGKSIRYKPVDGYLNDLKNDKFLERIRKVIRDIFDRDVPFVQTEHKNRCLYCQFNKICSRSED